METREFKVKLTDGQEVTLRTRNPNNAELQAAEDQYSIAFNNAIMKGIMPQAALVESLLKTGAWSDAKDAEIEEQRLKVVDLEEKLSKEDTQAGKEAIADKLRAERDILYRKRQARSALLAHTAESKAEDAQRDYIVSKVTELASSGVPVWKTYEDFKNEEDGGLVYSAIYEYLALANGLDEDFIANLPENQVKAQTETEVPEVETPKTEIPGEQTEAEKPAEA